MGRKAPARLEGQDTLRAASGVAQRLLLPFLIQRVRGTFAGAGSFDTRGGRIAEGFKRGQQILHRFLHLDQPRPIARNRGKEGSVKRMHVDRGRVDTVEIV